MRIKDIKVYCEKCNKKVEYKVINKTIDFYRDIEVNIDENIGVCLYCGEELCILGL